MFPDREDKGRGRPRRTLQAFSGREASGMAADMLKSTTTKSDSRETGGFEQSRAESKKQTRGSADIRETGDRRRDSHSYKHS